MSRLFLIFLLMLSLRLFSQEEGQKGIFGPKGNSPEVGVTQGSLSVSLTGGAVYDIPIAVPPGINGVVPQVALSYNSQSANGLAGYGWHISGVSVISRIPATRHHDGVIDGVDFDMYDRYALDGQRLIVKEGTSGVYGGNGVVYQTENFSNIRITSYGVHPKGVAYGPSHFRVDYPDGSHAVYGAGGNSRSLTDWAISYWQNPQGVRISYDYILSGNNLSINAIKYGARYSAPPINEILFVYKDRKRKEQAYIQGESFVRNTILSEIRVRSNNVGVRNYELKHGVNSLGYELLKSVTEKDGSKANALNPTVFKYDTTTNEDLFTISEPTTILGNVSSKNSSYISGDFDADGSMDFIMYPTLGSNAKKKFWLFRGLEYSNFNGGIEYNVGSFLDIFPTTWVNQGGMFESKQGWCVVQYDKSNNQTAFVHYSEEGFTGITHQKTFEFPRFVYQPDCVHLPDCRLDTGVGHIDINSVESEDFEFIDFEESLGCSSALNIHLSFESDGSTVLGWEQSGVLAPTMWEVCYFEEGVAPAPTDDVLVGTYYTTFSNSLELEALDTSAEYVFYVRSVCVDAQGAYQPNSWTMWSNTTMSNRFGPTNSVEQPYYTIPKHYLGGDFNGDGLTDVLVVDKTIYYKKRDCSNSHCYNLVSEKLTGGTTYLVELDIRKTTNYVHHSGNIDIDEDNRLVVADVNGDSKSDLIVFKKGSLLVYSLDQQGQLTLLFGYTDASIKYNMPFYMGDFNGDGKADFVIPQELEQDSWSFFLSKGNSFSKITTSIGINFYVNEYGYFALRNFNINTYSLAERSYVVNDFNGDGKSDILFQQNFTIEYVMRWYGVDDSEREKPQRTDLILFENVLSTDTTITFNRLKTNSSFAEVKRNAVPIFLNSKSVTKSLEYSLLTGTKLYSFRTTKDNKRDASLKEVILGNGLKDVITYSPLNSQLDVYDSYVQLESYPNFGIKTANEFRVVSQIEQLTEDSYKKQLFRYCGGVSNVEGLGFIGFREQIRTSWFNDQTPAMTSKTKYDISKRGAVSEVYSLEGTQHSFNVYYHNYITKTEFVQEASLLPNKVFKLKNVAVKQYNSLEQTSNEVQTVFDNYNNPTQQTTLYYNSVDMVASSLIHRKLSRFDYQHNTSASNYYVGRLTRVRNTDEVLSGNGVVTDTYSTEELYTYSNNHLLTKVRKKGHQTAYLTEDNMYDVYGNVIKKTISTTGNAPRVTEYTYDNTGRFLLTSKNIEGQVTTYLYNTYTGNLLLEEYAPAPGLVLPTTYGYDTWGRKVRETDYLGNEVSITYSKHPSNSALTVVRTVSDSGNHSVKLYNQLGQLTATSVRSISDNQWSTQLFEYGVNGEITKESEPFMVSDPLENLSVNQWNNTLYDQYGRVVEQKSYTGKTTHISYDGLVTTSNDGVKTVQTTRNAIGQITSLSDLGGNIQYKYFANGNLKESDFEGVKVVLEQDGWGRKTKLTDPSAGVYTYEYDNLGTLIKETTPKGATNYTFDNFGKLLSKTIVGDYTNSVITYSYDPATKQLVGVNHTDTSDANQVVNTVYNYQYDNYSRLVSTSENNGAVLFQKKYYYDNFGRINKEELKAVDLASSQTSEKAILHTYKNGYSWQMIDAVSQDVIWQTNTANARGQLVSAQLGNGVEITNTYDQYGFPLQIKHEKNAGVNPINMSLGTIFEPQRGLLLSRTNNLFSWSENLQYDDLDRLTHYKDVSNNLIEQLYDNKGRITENSLGTYTYDNNTNRNKTIALGMAAKAAYQLREGVFYDTMESNSGWKSANGTAVYDSTFYHEQLGGTSSLKIENFSSTQEKIIHSEVWIPINHTEPTQYTYSAWVYSNGPQVELFLLMKNANETGYMTTFDNVVSDEVGQWHYVTKTVTIPAHIKYISFRVDNNGKRNGGTTVWVDNVKIRKTSNAPVDSFTDKQLSMDYNVFKAPVTIYEPGMERLSFVYNAQGQRSVMYYGGLEANKLERPLQKYYSSDGSMEVKRNVSTGELEFVTYIGGDGYTAPAIYKKDNTTEAYFYLHRDYQGTIIAISNQQGEVVEKRLFDAWGKVLRVEDGKGRVLSRFVVLDRGYTGHEHLWGVGLIHMNGRLYDANLHRFLQPDNYVQDPFNTQNYNRYGYCLNNPFMYTDPSGEELLSAVIVGAIVGAVSYAMSAHITQSWSWEKFGIAILGGAVSGAVGGILGSTATLTTEAVLNAVATGMMSVVIPSYTIPIGDWSFSISPAIAFGNASGVGISVGVGYSDGNWSFSAGVGIMSYGNYNGFGKNAFEVRKSILAAWDDGKMGVSLGTNFWSGDFKQQTGMIGFRHGDFRMMYENDGGFGIKNLGLGDRGDSFRTAALNIGIGDFTAGFNLFTGKRDLDYEKRNGMSNAKGHFSKVEGVTSLGRKYPRGFVKEVGEKHRLGALTVGYKGFRMGTNSEKVRHSIQDRLIHGLIKDAGFENQSWNWKSYLQYRTSNKFTSW